MNTKIIKLDINRRLYDKIVAKQDDTKSRFLLFQLLDGAVPFNLTDRSVRVYGVKPDGAVIFNDLTVTHSTTGFCLLELTNQMLAIAGTVKLELMITEGDKKLTSIPFEMEVIKKINSNAAVESSNEFRSLLNALKEIDDWNREFADKSGKLEELYTPRLNELGSQLETKTNLTNKRAELLNEVSSTKGILELANFAGQGIVSNIIAFILHHYTDSGMIQFDNVGDGTILTLKNAHNPVRRPDKPSDYVGGGKFLSATAHNYEKGYSEEIFFIAKNGTITWTGVKGIATLEQNKQDDGTYAYRIKINNAHNYLLDLVNGSNQVFYMQNNVNKTRLDFVTPVSQTNGMYFETKAGGVRFKPANGVAEFIGDFRVGDGANWNYPMYSNKFCTSSSRPTEGIKAGDIYMETDTNKTIRRNASNNGWVDMLGNSI